MSEFRMPKLGADMDKGRLLQWMKQPGEPIARGEVIALVETDKANVDVESFVDGVVAEILVQPSDTWLPVGTPLAVIGERGAFGKAAAPIAAPATAPAPAPTRAPEPITIPFAVSAPPAVQPAPLVDAARIRVSPAARQRAHERGLEISMIHGTGPEGRITLRDVDAYVPASPPPTPGVERPAAPSTLDKRARMREAIAAAMARSKREIPHYYLGTSIDLARTIDWLSAINEKRPVVDRLILGVLLLKAVALALREVPELNGFYLDGHAQPSSAIHVGTAISLRGGGLLAPALLDTDQRSLTELMHDYQDLVQRARAGSLRSSEMTSPTITVTSLGDRGVETVYGVIYPPQVALVGFGKPADRPWVVDGTIVARPILQATLSADHRASDGHRGALFLEAIARLLQEPEKL